MVLTETGLAKVFQRIKSFVASQLNSKASAVHTHTSSDITDLPSGYVVDSALSSSSENPVQNKVVKNALDGLTSAGLLPVGSYIQFAGSQAPAGFLVCNGGAVSRTTYSELFAVIGTTYGSGDGSTTFNLPNLTDRFLQGSTTSGTVKNAGLPNITGWADGNLGLHVANGVFTIGNPSFDNTFYGEAYHSLNFNASQSNSIYGNSTTVQPPALTCLICIKY